MRICPTCRTLYPDDASFCTKEGARLVDAPALRNQDPLVGELLDQRYRIQSLLGEGGMSTVYMALHEMLRKKVAVKVLKKELLLDEHAEERFRREAMASCAVGSPHIIEVADIGRLSDGRLYYVMELLQGESLDQRMARESPLALEVLRDIGLQICEGLHAAHEQGIIHRDLKPENIFLTTFKGQLLVKILDFGIAKAHSLASASTLTKAGVIFGTPHYMSPEQAQGASVDRRSDIYSLGVVLYEMATGSRPFEAESAVGILLKHVGHPPMPPEMRAPGSRAAWDLKDLILKALAKEPDQRFRTLAEMGRSLAASPEDTGFHVEPTEPDWGPERLEPSRGGLEGLAQTDHAELVPIQEGRRAMGSLLARPAPPGPTRLRKPVVMVAALAAMVVMMAAFLLSYFHSGSPDVSLSRAMVVILHDAGISFKADVGRADLAPRPARVSLASRPSGAEVLHQGLSLGKTPCEVDLARGMVELEFWLKGRKMATQKVLVDGEKSLTVDLEPPSLSPPKPAHRAPGGQDRKAPSPPKKKRKFKLLDEP